ncbi:MAG: ABC transporter ATP-binding protein [Rhodospirillales bacterium]|nr:ABC transporter ATP-binding protein [Rhodospirillales bacterium]
MSLIEIDHLKLAIGDTPVLRDVSLDVRPGEIVGLLGPNGAGKTTTIAAALGLLRPQGGSVHLMGADPSDPHPGRRRHVGVLPDPNGFYDWMTAPDYLAFFADLHGVAHDTAALARRLGKVGLAPRRRQTIGTFSRGMRQRLGLARALVADPALLVLDEPTSGLDPRGRRDMHDLLLDLAGRGVGILLCTHILDDVERLCNRICVIDAGVTVVQGGLADLLAGQASLSRFRLELTAPLPPGGPTPAHIRVVHHSANYAIVDVDPHVGPPEAWRELFFLGWPILTIAPEGGGLEALYLALTGGIAPSPPAAGGAP